MAVIKRRPTSNARGISSIARPSAIASTQELLDIASANGVSVRPLDVQALTRAMGIRLQRRALPDELSGQLKATDEGWVITVNSLHHPSRQRFTIAHELAHFVLHSDDQSEFTDKTFFRSNETSPMETEANAFAADLIMPASEFHRFVNDESAKVEDIASHFSVSALAVRVRAKVLGYRNHGIE